jgi:hypothetical protein
MALISQPPTNAVDEGASQVSQGWAQFFSNAYNILNAVTMSGTTANRPTKFLFAGRPYFDTSLAANGKPIWRNKGNTGWIDATGAAV